MIANEINQHDSSISSTAMLYFIHDMKYIKYSGRSVSSLALNLSTPTKHYKIKSIKCSPLMTGKNKLRYRSSIMIV